MNIRVKTGNAEVGNSSIKIGKYTGKVKSQDGPHANHLFSGPGPDNFPLPKDHSGVYNIKSDRNWRASSLTVIGMPAMGVMLFLDGQNHAGPHENKSRRDPHPLSVQASDPSGHGQGLS